MDPAAKSRLVKRLAEQIGFQRVGITTPAPSRNAAYYRRWLQAGQAGSMAYLARNTELRENPALLLPDARSVICVAVSYNRQDPGEDEPQTLLCAGPQEQRRTSAGAAGSVAQPPPAVSGNAAPWASPAPPGRPSLGQPRPAGRVARYARGRDYHVVLGRMLRELVALMRAELDEPFKARVCVDTAPLIERELAAAAGIGWIGKNTLVLHELLGSYLLLGEVLTTLELEPDAPATDHCGTCTRCLEACPTQAFPAAYQMDASRCISYFTIEHRGDIPPEFRNQIGDWVFGCDVCQEVCPFNQRAPLGVQPEIMQSRVPARIDLLELVSLRSGAYRRLTRDTALGRATRPMLVRNAEIALHSQPQTKQRACADY